MPARYQRAYRYAQTAEEELDDESIEDLTFDLLSAGDQVGLDEFVAKLGRTVARAAKKAASDVSRTPPGKTVTKAADDIGRSKIARSVSKTATDVSKGVAKVGAAVPMLSTAVKLASRATPLGALARATYGAVSAALRGQNIFMGALDGVVWHAALSAGSSRLGGAPAARRERARRRPKQAVKAGIDDAREAASLCRHGGTVRSGIGTGVGAALGAANTLAPRGSRSPQALIARRP